MIIVLTPEICASLARDEFRKPGYQCKTNKALDKEICQSLIGTTYPVCCEIWNMIEPSSKARLKGAQVRHLFWALLLLKNYCTEPILTRVVGGVDAGTYRKWAWLFVDEIALLKSRVIIFKHRFRNWNGRALCLISVDGVDCPIEEQYPFDEEAYSQKFNGPGYKYEVGVCIATGEIVWINGPFKCGRGDKKIFEEDGLLDALADDELVEADGAYQGNARLKTPGAGQTADERGQANRVRGRGENVNGWLKKFAVLANVFRHDPKTKHRICFESVAVITQLRFEFHGTLYDVPYDARYD